MPPPPPPTSFDPAALGAAFGADLQSVMAAALAQGLDSNTMAQLNAIAQLNQLASNQKIAAAMLQQQQQQQQHFLGSSSNPLAAAVAVAAAAAAASSPSHHNMGLPSHLMGSGSSSGQMNATGNAGSVKMNQTRYQQLLGLIDEMGREIRSTYVGNKNSMERLKRGIASARILVKDCQLECERNMKQ